MSDIVIYGIPGSPYLRSALLGLEEKRAPYRLAVLSMGAGRTEEYLQRQPFGRIPTMEHGDFRLYETQAMLRYIDAVGTGPSLQPKDARAAARMNQVIGIVDWYVFPSITVGVCAERLMSQIFWGRPAEEANVATALPMARICVRELERLKGSAEFMAGDTLSIADLMLVPHIEFFRRTPEGMTLLKGTSLEAWLTRMSARASMHATEAERLRMIA
ncbi:MAG: putative glutathione S-transferase [Gammaproteobacteria bacterium]|nr:putative glutathione S-transferase [Gammaproteobacteria bacterium]